MTATMILTFCVCRFQYVYSCWYTDDEIDRKSKKNNSNEKEREKMKIHIIKYAKIPYFYAYLLCFMRFSLLHWYWSVLDFGFGFISMASAMVMKRQFSPQ